MTGGTKGCAPVGGHFGLEEKKQLGMSNGKGSRMDMIQSAGNLVN